MSIARRHITRLIIVLLIGAVEASSAVGAASAGDFLYIGDAADNTVKQFDATTGTYLGNFITPGAQLQGPQGILHLSNGNFLVSNQQVSTPINGEIDQYASNGKSLGPLVPKTDPNAPFAPQGIILSPDKSTLYVADLGRGDVGAVKRYNASSGQDILPDLDFGGFITNATLNPTGEFHPRGLVFGSDGTLYVSLFSEKSFLTAMYGWVLRYDPATRGVSVFASYQNTSDLCSQYLNAPDGLTFGPNGNLYLVGRRLKSTANTGTDKILIFNGATGACQDWINLDQSGGPNAYAQAFVFGPGGFLYLPVRSSTTPAASDTGGVRRYNVSTKEYTPFVSPIKDGDQLASWWYLTFGQTSPVTLAYQN